MSNMVVLRETIEYTRGAWWFCQRGVYSEGSILAGQKFRQLVRPYPSQELAQRDHPKARFCDEPVKPVYIPITPPKWFDPAEAGEEWNEEEELP